MTGSVMTHPARGDAAKRIVAQAPAGMLSVVTDPDPTGPPTAVRTAVAAWESVPASSTHHLVVQDDMLFATGAFDRLLQAVSAAPDAALALYSMWDSRNAAAVRLGALSGAGWVSAVNEYTPTGALVLPRAVAAGFADDVRRHPSNWPDDILMHRYLRREGVRCLVAVPTLAEHQDAPSIVGNAFRGLRKSPCFLPVVRPGPQRIDFGVPSVVPFFKNGVAQCVVRSNDMRSDRWLHLEISDYLGGLGVPERHLRPRAPAELDNVDPAVVRGTWLTAFALGMLTEGACGDTDPDVVREALRTIGPGGTSQTPGGELSVEACDQLAVLARLALGTGRETTPRPRRRSGGITVVGDGVLAEHIVRTLTDLGHAVTVVRGASAPRRGRTHGNIVLDLTRGGGPLLRLGSRVPLRLDSVDLYGPGYGPDSTVGALVWAALQSEPIRISARSPAVVRPLHVRELVEQVRAIACGTAERFQTPPEYPIEAFARIVAQAVRPVPVHDTRSNPPPTAAGRSQSAEDLQWHVHHFAQWLAYEFDGTDPATITRTPG
ncbi:hypothetical protein [Actinokineospora iranica]|uniref:hypothetical protein n=1 Tax=Actinokineospora iranica TaxID=1271860 RepID=UPI001113A263|nr:hypothetical protein [Actinokineospora iranica]